jgi:hypothetical protein
MGCLDYIQKIEKSQGVVGKVNQLFTNKNQR